MNFFSANFTWRFTISFQKFSHRNLAHLNFSEKYLFSTMSNKCQPEWHAPENKEPLPTLKLYNSLTKSKVTNLHKVFKTIIILTLRKDLQHFVKCRSILFRKKENK